MMPEVAIDGEVDESDCISTRITSSGWFQHPRAPRRLRRSRLPPSVRLVLLSSPLCTVRGVNSRKESPLWLTGAAVAAPARVAVPFEVDEMMPEVAIDGEVDESDCVLLSSPLCTVRGVNSRKESPLWLTESREHTRWRSRTLGGAEGCAAVAAPARVAVPFEVDEMMPEVAIDGHRCVSFSSPRPCAPSAVSTHGRKALFG
jgi:hypothetical protein